MSRKTSKLKQRIRIAQDAVKEAVKKQRAAELAAALAKRQLDAKDALRIRLETPHNPFGKVISLRVDLHPEAFAFDFFAKYRDNFGDISRYASLVGREVGEKVAAAIQEHVTDGFGVAK